jgi:hypothetical protein
MSYRVIRDQGVTIAGQFFPHGSGIASNFTVPELPELPDTATAAEREARKQEQLALAKQAQADIESALKASHLEPAQKTAAKPAEKEG